MPRLVALFGPKRGVTREFDGVLRIGRGPDADLQLIDERVSRDHCIVESTPQGVVLRDLGSRNGTWLNGRRLSEQATLQAGDQLAIGESLLAFDPELSALRSRQAEITLVLTRQQTAAARRARSASGASGLERLGPLLARLAASTDEREAAKVLCEAAGDALEARGAAVVALGAGQVTRVLWGTPVNGQVTVPAELVVLAAEERRVLCHPVEQTLAEVDEATTRVRAAPGFVACAPAVRLGRTVGVLCVERARDFSDGELELLGALATLGASGLQPASAPVEVASRPLAHSRAMLATLELAEAAARAPSTVLLQGETGTGKEEVARFIHAASPRHAGPFVAINCGAIAPELAESELFGHEKGAFTGASAEHPGVFERADGGTLLLDEVGDLPPALQVKLLRVLQDRLVTRVGARAGFSVDVRVVAATHRDLRAQVKAGAFREDLFWRLNVVGLSLAPLRERREDIGPLAELFLQRFARQLGVISPGFSAEARAVLERYGWPGNVRQLANAAERAVVLKRAHGPISVIDLPAELSAPGPVDAPGATGSLAEQIARLEREQVSLALHRARGVKAAAAQALGISRPTLDRKISELKIDLFADPP